MNFIIVDPFTRIISREEVGTATLPIIYKLIGCDCIAGYPFPASDHHFYCDDIGRFHNPPLPQFWLERYPDPVCGRILIFRITGDGKEISPSLTVDEVYVLVDFI